MGTTSVRTDERVLVRVLAADPRSDWVHGFSAGHLYLTDRRLVLRPWAVLGGTDSQPWELSVDTVLRVSSAPVPVWLFGLIRIWLHGIRLVTLDGKGKTIIMGRTAAMECVATLDGILKAGRRSPERTGAHSPS